MAKFSTLPAASALDGIEIAAAVQSGVSVRTTLQAIANLFKGTRGADIASASSIDLGAATGSNVHVTGTATISALGTVAAGVERTTIFDGALQLTHNATSMILLTGANITTAAGDVARWVSEGSGNWRMIAYARKSGAALFAAAAPNPVTALATSGTIAIDCSLGDYFTLAATGNMTSFTFSNLPASGKAQTLMIRIKQDATGSRAATWPASFKWAGGVAGVLSTAANATDVLAITTFDQGTTWDATLAKAFA